VSQTKPKRAAISVIRFSRRIAGQCSAKGSPLPDWVVCDTIANGTRFLLGRRGPCGGALVRFERTFAPGRADGPRPASGPTVQVLCEVAGASCVALQLLSDVRPGKKLGIFGIFESRRLKMNASTRSPL
jgi:hypothetical protein